MQKIPRATFAAYAENWLTERELKQRTRQHYRRLFDQHLLGTFGSLPLASTTSEDVRAWYAGFGDKAPTARAHSYGLLRAVTGTSVNKQPCNT